MRIKIKNIILQRANNLQYNDDNKSNVQYKVLSIMPVLITMILYYLK